MMPALLNSNIGLNSLFCACVKASKQASIIQHSLVVVRRFSDKWLALQETMHAPCILEQLGRHCKNTGSCPLGELEYNAKTQVGML